MSCSRSEPRAPGDPGAERGSHRTFFEVRARAPIGHRGLHDSFVAHATLRDEPFPALAESAGSVAGEPEKFRELIWLDLPHARTRDALWLGSELQRQGIATVVVAFDFPAQVAEIAATLHRLAASAR